MKCVRRLMPKAQTRGRVFRRKKTARGAGYLLLSCDRRRHRGGCKLFEVVLPAKHGRCKKGYRRTA